MAPSESVCSLRVWSARPALRVLRGLSSRAVRVPGSGTGCGTCRRIFGVLDDLVAAVFRNCFALRGGFRSVTRHLLLRAALVTFPAGVARVGLDPHRNVRRLGAHSSAVVHVKLDLICRARAPERRTRQIRSLMKSPMRVPRTSIFHSLCGPGVPRIGNASQLADFVRVDESDDSPFRSAQLGPEVEDDRQLSGRTF